MLRTRDLNDQFNFLVDGLKEQEVHKLNNFAVTMNSLAKTISSIVAQQTGLPDNRVSLAIQLLDDGASIPFLARYRKEATGGMSEVDLELILKASTDTKELLKRKEHILKVIREGGLLTRQLEDKINNCFAKSELEDLYLPFKPKRKTKATVARDNGLEPLATAIYRQGVQDPYSLAAKFVSKQADSVELCVQGACDIIAEWISENLKVRNKVRFLFERWATINSKCVKGKELEGQKYLDYFSFSEPLKKCPSHRILAIRRGEKEGFLKCSISIEEDRTLKILEDLIAVGRGPSALLVINSLRDAYKRLLLPAIETEFRNISKEQADKEAVGVFRNNLQQLLMAPPLGEKFVLAIDPGFRSGCKIVALNSQGGLIRDAVIYPHPPQSRHAEAEALVHTWIQEESIEAIAIGNGTAGKETFKWIESLKLPKVIQVYLVNESGASIYSASEVGREEFPDKDLTVRGAVSIGRRLMDPLSELVKIDPQSIGVGQYQHDVDQNLLKEGLDHTVVNCVNSVGVNLNTASKHLLAYVSGLGPALAKAIVGYRELNGPFTNRQQLRNIPRLGEKAFEQCAGFLRIKDGEEPLDNTAIHPERYDLVRRIFRDMSVTVERISAFSELFEKIDLSKYTDREVGLPTLEDIRKELLKPGLDPRGKARPMTFSNIESIEQLSPGMMVTGLVNNITNFGAFIDIGIKHAAFLHVSKIAKTFIKNPAEVLSVGQELEVRILEVDTARHRISVTLLY